MTITEIQKPGLWASLRCFGGILLIVAVGLLGYGISMHVLLVMAIVWASFNAILLGAKFPEIKKSMSSGIEKGLPAIYIFILIGVVIAAFVESGTIASIVYYSLDLLNPVLFLPAGMLLCTFMSLATGTAWGTAGTVGVVLMGLGDVLGIPLPIVAGMVVSGASFGDKMSPVSDTTNLAATCAETDLYTHIKAMSYTTVPTYILCLIIFSFIGMGYAERELPLEEINYFKDGLQEIYLINPLAFLPLLVLLVMSISKVSAEPSMLASVAVSIVLALFMQDRSFLDVLSTLQNGYVVSSDQESINTLLNRGGIQSMMWTLSLALFALALGGILNRFKFLEVLLASVLGMVQRSASLIAVTIASCFLGNLSMGEGYLSIIMGCQLFKEKFKENLLRRSMLSRTVEEGATLTVALVPWSTTGAFYFAVLGVSPISYAQYSFLNYINPLLSITLAFLGFCVFKKSNPKQLN